MVIPVNILAKIYWKRNSVRERDKCVFRDAHTMLRIFQSMKSESAQAVLPQSDSELFVQRG